MRFVIILLAVVAAHFGFCLIFDRTIFRVAKCFWRCYKFQVFPVFFQIFSNSMLFQIFCPNFQTPGFFFKFFQIPCFSRFFRQNCQIPCFSRFLAQIVNSRCFKVSRFFGNPVYFNIMIYIFERGPASLAARPAFQATSNL